MPLRIYDTARARAPPTAAGGVAPEARGLGRSPACSAFDGPARPLAEQLELLSAAQAAVELHFSFPGESAAFVLHAAPAILRLVAAMGYAPSNAAVRAVHAVLLRTACPERVGDTDQIAYRAMGVPARSFKRWKRQLDALRAAASPAGAAPDEDALDAAGVLVRFASPTSDTLSAPPSPPHSSGGGSSGSSRDDSPRGDGVGTPQGPRSAAARRASCHALLCGGAPPFADEAEPPARPREFWCRRVAADAFICLGCGTRFQSLELERRYQRESPRAAPPDGGCGALVEVAPATSLGVHNISMDGRPIAQERAALLRDGLAVPCELAEEYGGLGLRYSAGTHLSAIPAGTVIGIYPISAGLRTRAHHCGLPTRRAGAHRGEYATELRGRMLYARAGQRGAGSINEHCWPNVEFAEVDVDMGAGDHSLFTVLAVIATRRISPGDMLHADYGASYQEVRDDPERGYAVARLVQARLRAL